MKIRHGQSTTTYRSGANKSWTYMKYRCDSLSGRYAERYRGLGYDPRWASFENFYADMGDRPEGMTLERRDNARGYSKDNCRWATRADQVRNRSTSKFTFTTAVIACGMLLRGDSQASIARQFGATCHAVHAMKKGYNWVDAMAKAREVVCQSPT